MSLSREPRQKWNSWDQLVQETAQVDSPLAPYGLRLALRINAMRYLSSIVPQGGT
jgi:hypothetical protein